MGSFIFLEARESDPTLNLVEKTFWRAFSQKEDELMEDEKLSEEDKQKEARQFGKTAMVQAIRDGKEYIPEIGRFAILVGPATETSCTEIYGKVWDEQYK